MRGKSAERAGNLGDYLDVAHNWAQSPGSGAITGQMMDFYQQKMRTQGWTARQDLLNVLR